MRYAPVLFLSRFNENILPYTIGQTYNFNDLTQRALSFPFFFCQGKGRLVELFITEDSTLICTYMGRFVMANESVGKVRQG
ncbi:MAG: hypothetical protein KKH60_00555 [Proteobacteria bacterium]|nr:hypothetical protein [Pseudomonadota bacterium]